MLGDDVGAQGDEGKEAGREQRPIEVIDDNPWNPYAHAFLSFQLRCSSSIYFHPSLSYSILSSHASATLPRSPSQSLTFLVPAGRVLLITHCTSTLSTIDVIHSHLMQGHTSPDTSPMTDSVGHNIYHILAASRLPLCSCGYALYRSGRK